MTQTKDPIMAYLQTANQLQAFCSQNGWIISESIKYEVVQREPDSLTIYTTFLESIMEGSGCQCDQKSCYGRMKLSLDSLGGVISSVVV